MNNIKLSYLYRDAGNYKQFGEVVFCNPSNIALEHVNAAIQLHLIDGTYFYPEKWELPTLYAEVFDPELDVSWHEFEEIAYTLESPTFNRSIDELLEGFVHESGCDSRTV